MSMLVKMNPNYYGVTKKGNVYEKSTNGSKIAAGFGLGGGIATIIANKGTRFETEGVNNYLRKFLSQLPKSVQNVIGFKGAKALILGFSLMLSVLIYSGIGKLVDVVKNNIAAKNADKACELNQK